MKNGRRLSKAEKIRRAKKVCELYATDQYSLIDCLRSVGVNSDSTWSKWCNDIEEIGELYKEAQEKSETAYFNRLKIKARGSLEKRIEGFTQKITETKYEEGRDGNPKIKEQVIKERYHPPSERLIEFVLTNKDEPNFKHKRFQEIKTEGLRDLIQGMDDATLEHLVNRLVTSRQDDSSQPSASK